MKILHISTNQSGGAATAAIRLHKALLLEGEESRMLTLTGENSDITISVYKPLLNYGKKSGIPKLIKGLIYRLNIGIGYYWRLHDTVRREHGCQYTFPITLYRVERHPLVRWADIIHLHHCDDFINYPTFFRKIKKPIVWTLHDIGIGYGGFHYKYDYETFYPIFEELEKKLYAIKEKAVLSADNLTLISLSNDMYTFTQGIDFLARLPNKNAYNITDTSLFVMKDRLEARFTLGLPTDKTILLFISENINTKSKGLDTLKQAIRELDNTNLLLCIVGNYDKKIPKQDSVATRYFGTVCDKNTLSEIYSSSDLLVVPSTQESFCQTPLESMACGTPVVVFPTGAMRDYVKPEQGVVCRDCSVSALVDGINKALHKKYVRSIIREYVTTHFSPSIIAKSYINIYKNALKELL